VWPSTAVRGAMSCIVALAVSQSVTQSADHVAHQYLFAFAWCSNGRQFRRISSTDRSGDCKPQFMLVVRSVGRHETAAAAAGRMQLKLYYRYTRLMMTSKLFL